MIRSNEGATSTGGGGVTGAGGGDLSHPASIKSAKTSRFILDVAVVVREELPISHRTVLLAHDDEIAVGSHEQ